MFTRRDVLLIGGGAAGALAGLLLRRNAGTEPRLRPPGAGTEEEFLAACIRCGQCVQACPTGVLRTSSDVDPGHGTPYFAAREKACNLCAGESEMKCIAVCPTAALEPVADRSNVRIGTAVIDPEICLAHQGVVCRTCWHACPFPDRAIRLAANLRPKVRPCQCTGCGLCEYACPTETPAIVVRPRGSRSVA